MSRLPLSVVCCVSHLRTALGLPELLAQLQEASGAGLAGWGLSQGIGLLTAHTKAEGRCLFAHKARTKAEGRCVFAQTLTAHFLGGSRGQKQL